MIFLVGGTRPNFMKIAAISRAFDILKIAYEIINTGQHFDHNMNAVFFKDFNLKKPKYHLDVKAGNHGEQTGLTMIEFEKVCLKDRPDMILVVGDVNSTMACALVGAKLHIPVAHQEAGMRSGDMAMPEEVNRIVTDHISQYLFPISVGDQKNLLKEGISQEKIFLVGDVMIDNLLHYTDQIEVKDKKHILVELHRPANVDDEENLREILIALEELADNFEVIFVIHPRTKKMINEFGLAIHLEKLRSFDAVGYFKFLEFMKNAMVVITDSDGIQQETSVLNIPCVSIRDTTNIPYTIFSGTNTLSKPETSDIYNKVMEQTENPKQNRFPEMERELNDGNAAVRLAMGIKMLL